jgi:hypothetical protein
VIALLAAADPGDPDAPPSWPAYAQLTPHVLATARLGDHDPAGRQLILHTTGYMQAHGDSSGSRAIGEALLDRWRAVLSPDHPDTLSAASSLTVTLFVEGAAEPARALGEDTLQRCHPVLGADHATTLMAATALALVLVSLGEDTQQRCRRILGPDHVITLWAAAALTRALAETGDAEAARTLGEDTQQRSRRALGLDHPVTRHLLQEAGPGAGDVYRDAGAPGQSP